MTCDELMRMAREAGLITGQHWKRSAVDTEHMMEFAALVAAHERKACEALYAHEDVQAPVGNSAWGEAYQDGWIAGAQAYRDAIRARGNA